MSNLILGLQFEEQLPAAVRDELRQAFAAIQSWASQLNLSGGNIKAPGIGTFLGQPRCRLFRHSNLSIANSTDTVVTWDVARSGSPYEEYDDYAMFDGSQYIMCSEPGLYLAVTQIQWAGSATGTRSSGIHPRISAVDYFNQSFNDGSANGNYQETISVFPVIDPGTSPVSYAPFPLGIGVQVNQSSGGALNIATSSSLGVWKIS